MSGARSASLVDRVARTYVAGIALATLTIVLVSGLVGSALVVHRDDADAIALGRLLVAELEDEAEDRDELVRHELAEQRWFLRHIEVWLDGTRLGGPTREGSLASFADAEDESCRLAWPAGRAEHVCVVHAPSGEAIVVATPLAPLLGTMAPLFAAQALVALVVALAAAAIGRRAMVRSVSGLTRLEQTVAAVPARGGRRAVGSVWGASELDSLGASVDGLLARLDEAAARERRFVADAAHELRTPLTRLRAQLELARAEHAEGKTVDERLAAAQRTAIELGTTTEALLAMARDEIGTTEPVELADVVEACLERLTPAERERVRVVGGAEAIAEGVEPMLALATKNLVDNALAYTRGAVTVRIDAERTRARLVVEDEGPGVSEEERARLIQPFVRGAAAAGTRGAGLGLALADHVARLHHGALVLANRTPTGLSVSLEVQRWRPFESR